MTAALPTGRKMCPGWTSEYASGTAECGGTSHGRRRADPALIRDTSDMCARCHRQKSKWDEEHGAKAAREQRDRDNYEALIDVYVADMRVDLDLHALATLDVVLPLLDALASRGTWPPFARFGEEGYRALWNERGIPAPVKLNILHRLVGLPIEHPR